MERDCVGGDPVERDSWRRGKIETEELDQRGNGDVEERRYPIAHPMKESQNHVSASYPQQSILAVRRWGMVVVEDDRTIPKRRWKR